MAAGAVVAAAGQAVVNATDHGPELSSQSELPHHSPAPEMSRPAAESSGPAAESSHSRAWRIELGLPSPAAAAPVGEPSATLCSLSEHPTSAHV